MDVPNNLQIPPAWLRLSGLRLRGEALSAVIISLPVRLIANLPQDDDWPRPTKTMDSIRALLGLKPRRVPPPKIETDEIFPVHFFDDTPTYRDLILCWTLRFNDVLDADKLHDALVRLLNMGDWRKLGGRLRLRVSERAFTVTQLLGSICVARSDGRLEIHVPTPFTPARPPVRFSHITFDVSIKEHPLASQLPQPTPDLSLHPSSVTFRPFGARSDAPTTIDDFLYSDEPQLSLHVTSFRDATLVALSWPHTMTSGLGRRDLVAAWSLVLAGREAEVPPMLGAREDPLEKPSTAAVEDQEPYVLEPKRIPGLGMLWFGLRFAWELLWYSVEGRMMCLPPKFVARLRQEAVEGLKAAGGGGGGGGVDGEEDVDVPFLSDGDIISAWATRLVSVSRGPSRPITAINAVDIRGRVKSAFDSGAAYVQNLALGTFTFFTAHEIPNLPLGQLAYRFRRSIQEQVSEPQVLALMRLMRAQKPPGSPMLFGEANALLVVFSSWAKAKFYESVDFGPAVVSTGAWEERPSHVPGRMVYHHAQSMVESAMTRNVFNILGKDPQENYWISAFLLHDSWAKIEEEIRNSA
ncbi:hypothetical protein SODALDRAFT_374374 [Sodiomyces alkalinus F11]|uniref:LysR family regulatory protein n=1 Tax=Sodiomyces alkalinus (strain CBS 110278 / VKM F-3762 / F11) TaxID=1314773 RepID=A0A3N2Q5G1_SODAK|nr:hypothetical protein SODALDRAFT_374374 [Sodiomyces alkalinus F11]ROT41992.1 hypothetical protein SODALDRAFT_374374 [Sodiomyces alkalinus F11]